MPTGDLSNNIRKMRSKLKEIKYTEDCDVSGLAEGLPTAYLPVYHYTFTNYSPAISQLILDKGIELYGKSDARFIEAVYKILRDVFAYKPPITKEQFFAKGFSERKVIMCTEILNMVKDKNNELNPGKSKTSLKTSVRPKSAVDTRNLPYAGIAMDSQTGVRPKSAADTRNLPLAVPKSKNPASGKQSLGEGDIEPQVVNELIAPAPSEPVRHLSSSFNHSMPVRHTASQGRVNTSQNSDQSDSMPSKPPSIISHHAALLRSENRQIKHVSIQSPRDMKIISPESSSDSSRRFASPGRGDQNFSSFSSPDQTRENRAWVFDENSQDSFEAARSKYMTPSIKKVCPKSVEVVTIPRGEKDEDLSIVEIQAPTSDSVLHGPVPSSHPELMALAQTVEFLKEQVVELAESASGGNSDYDRKLDQVLSSLENLTARILLLENRMSILEAKVGDVQLKSVSSAATGPLPSQPKPAHTSQSLQVSFNSPGLFAGPGNSFAEELKSIGSSQRAESIKDSTDFSLNYSPIRKVTNGVVGSVMSANEDTFALETEDDARRASTPTLGDTRECDTSLQCNISHVETKHAVSRINNMIKQTTLMMKEKPKPGQLNAPDVSISN